MVRRSVQKAEPLWQRDRADRGASAVTSLSPFAHPYSHAISGKRLTLSTTSLFYYGAEFRVPTLGPVSSPWLTFRSAFPASKPNLGHTHPPATPPPHLGCWWPCLPLSGRHPRRPQQPAQWSWGEGQWDSVWVRCPLLCPSPPQWGHPQEPHLSWECSFVALELKSSQMG